MALAAGLAGAFALATGLTEAGLLAAARYCFGRLTHTTPQAVWLAPVAYGMLFSLPAAAWALWGARRPQGAWLPGLVATLAFLSSYSVLLLATMLHPLARATLAVGVAAQLAATARRHERLLRRALPRVVALLALLSIGLGAAYNTLWALREQRALAALPAARPGAPNVVLLIWDTVRARSLGLYGHARPNTPHLEALAATGVTFDRAISAAPWTLPSHVALFTGRYPHETSAGWRTPLDGGPPLLAELLAKHGYVTAGFVANTHYVAAETGLARGMSHYEDWGLFSGGDLLMSTALGRMLSYNRAVRVWLDNPDLPARKSAERVNRAFVRWLDRRDAERPFFAFLNLYDAHAPYLPPAPYDTLFRSTRWRRPPLIEDRGSTLSPEQVRAAEDAYDGAIAYLDWQLGNLLGELRRRGVLDNTIVIVASDHGEEFGEHGVFTHGNSLYVPGVHVPLVVAAPGRVPADRRVEATVSLRDIPSTILELAGIAPTLLPGRSLVRYWGPRPARDAELVLAEVGFASGLPAHYPVSAGDMRSLFVDRFHYILGGDGRMELYDLRRDPDEKRDLLLPGRSVNGGERGRVRRMPDTSASAHPDFP